jgi:hypothetical protein
MTTDINTILSYETINLSPFEIRGARSGVNNASTTGPVYTGGTYVPADSSVGGSGTFSSDTTVSGFSFDAPYGSLDTDSLKVGDNLTADATTYRITNIDTTNSFQIDPVAGISGVYPISLDLDQREYVAEPDVINNTSTGTANFFSGSQSVDGTGFNALTGGDFIKHDGYQDFYRIDQVINDNSLNLVSAYGGDTTSGTYTAKRWKIGRTKIQYAKNNFIYDGQKAKWVYDSIMGNDLTTSTNFAPLADGIELAFTRALNVNDPDLMDVAVANNQTFATETQYEAFQFALPAVPNPESSMELFINDVKKVMYQDYVLTYSQSPLYEPPPPLDQRFVANIMFLDGISGIQPSTELTESGQMLIIDSEGEAVPGIFSRSESISVDGTAQLALRDYMLEPNTGTLEITDTVIDEHIVKYVADDFSEYIDYGFSVFLNGKKQKISFPAEVDDDILFQPANGRIKPRGKDHPGPEEIYEVNYMVETTSVSDEIKKGIPGNTVIALNKYPVKQDSIFLVKNKTFLEEGVDFFVSYLTGRILLSEASTGNDIFQISYTPLSKQVNDLTYEDGAWYCTVHDARLTVRDAANFKFTLANILLDVNNIEILRIYNETRDKDYSLTGYSTDGTSIILQKNSTNVSIGLDAEDVVIIDYKFESETLEYSPVIVNYLNIEEGSETIYIEGSDLTSFINADAIMVIARPDAASETYHAITSATYDNYGTRINLNTSMPEDVVNPRIGISDSSATFLNVPLNAAPLVRGNTSISFPGTNIRNLFRPKTILDVEEDLYQVSSATYDNETSSTVVSLSSEILYDRTDSSSLSGIKYSDNPIYSGGDTEITLAMPAVTLFNQSAFIMSNDSDRILSVASTSTELTIDGTAFSYENSSTLGDLSSAIDSSNIDALALTTYASAWQSDKIIPVTDISVYRDSSMILYATDALRYMDIDSTVYTDSSNFTVSEAGTVILTNGLQRGDRYKFDYLGREFLGDGQVEYSLRYFVSLPAKSKISASFQYNNLDQFYIQVMNQMDFLERVTIPRMEEEAKQLNGNVGQGGSLPSDDGPTNDDGGITGDEYRRKDTEIECRVFKNIYDFYQNRLLSYGTEMEAGFGLRLFNNDGTFSEAEQDGAAKVISRIFPDADYTNFEPIRVNPLTGYFFDEEARFTKNSATVTGTNTFWTKQLLDARGYIGSVDSTRRYEILSISNNTTLILEGTFEENTVTGPYTATNGRYPIYDDDGFLGGKIIGSKNKNFGLISGDAFNCTIDDVGKDYTFEFPTGPFIGDLFSDPDGPTVARLLTSGIDGLTCTSERILDPTTTYGYKNTLVMRTTYPANKLEMGDNTTVDKLGFSSDQTATGNLDRTDQRPEIVLDGFERNFISAEQGYLNTLNFYPDKLDRTSPAGITATNNAAIEMTNERNTIFEEIPKIEVQITATGNIIAEGGIPSGDASAAHLAATLFLTDTSTAKADIDPILLNWEGKGVNWKWSLDFIEHTQIVRGLDGAGIGIETGWVTDIEGQTSFILQAPAGDDRRILDAVIFSVPYTPAIEGETDSSTIPGVWTGWEVSYDYSLNNQITFNINTPTVITLTDTTTVSNLRYMTDTTAINLLWEISGDTYQEVYRYNDYNSVGAIKAALNSSAVVSATGSAIYNSNISEAFVLTTQYINPTAIVTPGLRKATVTYQTISDKLLDERLAFINPPLGRDSTLSIRISFLETREPQLYNSISNEGLLLDGGDPGDIYAWANNRFNRRQGCYAKLKQIEQQIASNKSALDINKSFI